MGFRDNLRNELDFSGMLVKELSAASGVQKRALDTYLLQGNASMPPADTAVKIARALGVTVEYLVTGEETALPDDVRLIIRTLLKLAEKDRKVVAVLVNALVDRQGNKWHLDALPPDLQEIVRASGHLSSKDRFIVLTLARLLKKGDGDSDLG